MLLLRGEMSELLDEATAARMAEGLDDFTFVTVARRGHAPLLTEPEAVEAIDGFLERF